MSLSVYLSEEVYNSNITHNLNKMAAEAGIYRLLWYPEEEDITYAEQLIEPLEKAIEDMESRPEHYKTFDSPNGWGLYVNFLPWLKRLLDACVKHPDSTIRVSV
jgi:hypothetical protein